MLQTREIFSLPNMHDNLNVILDQIRNAVSSVAAIINTLDYDETALTSSSS